MWLGCRQSKITTYLESRPLSAYSLYNLYAAPRWLRVLIGKNFTMDKFLRNFLSLKENFHNLSGFRGLKTFRFRFLLQKARPCVNPCRLSLSALKSVEGSDLQVGWGKIKKVTEKPHRNEMSPLIHCCTTVHNVTFTCVGWQVTLWDLTRNITSRSSEATWLVDINMFGPPLHPRLQLLSCAVCRRGRCSALFSFCCTMPICCHWLRVMVSSCTFSLTTNRS